MAYSEGENTKFGALILGQGKDHFYIMHLSHDGKYREDLWNYAKDNNIIGLRHVDVNCNWTRIREKTKSRITKGWIRQFDTFCGMRKGDIVMVLNGMDSVLGVARTTEPRHRYNKRIREAFFDHVRRVEWIRKYEYSRRKKLPKLLEGFSHTLSRVASSSPRWDMLTNLNL